MRCTAFHVYVDAVQGYGVDVLQGYGVDLCHGYFSSDIGSMCWMYSIEHWPDVFGVATLARCIRWDARERLGICSMYSICSVISSMYSTGHAGKMCIAKMCIGKIGIGHMCIVSRRHLGFRFVLYCEDI